MVVAEAVQTPFENDQWFNDLVIDLVKKYGFRFDVIKSTLMDKPNI